MENSLNKYQNNSKYGSGEKSQQPSTYGEYLKQKKIDADKAIGSKSEMQEFLNASFTKRTMNAATKDVRGEHKNQQSKSSEEYLRNKQMKFEHIEPSTSNPMHGLDVSEHTTYGECRRGKQLQQVPGICTETINNTQDYSSYGEYCKRKQSQELTNIANKIMQNIPKEMELKRLEVLHSPVEKYKKSTYGEYLRNKKFSQDQTNYSRDKKPGVHLGEYKQEKPNLNEDYRKLKQVSNDRGRTSEINSRITSNSNQIKELQHHHRTNVEYLKNINDNSNSTTTLTSERVILNKTTNNSNEIRTTLPRKAKRKEYNRVHFEEVINRLSKLDQNSLTEDQKRELNYAKTELHGSILLKEETPLRQPFKRIVVDKSSVDWSISRNNYEEVEAKLIDIFFQIVADGNATVPVMRDAGWYQGFHKLLFFGDRTSIRLYREKLVKLGELWPGAVLALVCIHDLPPRPAAIGFIPAKPANGAAALKLLKDSNPHLPTDDWILRKFGKAEDHRRKIVILINTRSLPQLEESASIISYGFGQVDLKIYNQERDLWRIENMKPDDPRDLHSIFKFDSNNQQDEPMEYSSRDEEDGEEAIGNHSFV